MGHYDRWWQLGIIVVPVCRVETEAIHEDRTDKRVSVQQTRHPFGGGMSIERGVLDYLVYDAGCPIDDVDDEHIAHMASQSDVYRSVEDHTHISRCCLVLASTRALNISALARTKSSASP